MIPGVQARFQFFQVANAHIQIEHITLAALRMCVCVCVWVPLTCTRDLVGAWYLSLLVTSLPFEVL